MKKIVAMLASVAVGIGLAGCYSPQGRPDYTASGALAGGATGAVVGSMSRHPGAGALVGAVVGGIIGHGMDQAQEAQLRAQAPQTYDRVEQGQPLTVNDVQALAKARISDDLIISQIRNSRTVYHLTTADIITLKNTGVSDRVIDFMINTPSQLNSAQVSGVVGQAPPPAPPETVVAAPGPDYIWVSGAWFWLGDGWVWHRGYWHRPAYPHRHRW
jgi:Glycine zipper